MKLRLIISTQLYRKKELHENIELIKANTKSNLEELRTKINKKEKEMCSYYETIESEIVNEFDSLKKVLSSKMDSLNSNTQFLEYNVKSSIGVGLLEFYSKNVPGINEQLEAEDDKIDINSLKLPNASSEAQKKLKEEVNSIIEIVNQIKPIALEEQ